MTSAILIMAIVPLALLLVIVISQYGKRLDEHRRRRVERGLTWFLYPVVIASCAWQVCDNWRDGDASGAGIMVALVGMFAIQFVVALRSHTLFPRYRAPKA